MSGLYRWPAVETLLGERGWYSQMAEMFQGLWKHMLQTFIKKDLCQYYRQVWGHLILPIIFVSALWKPSQARVGTLKRKRVWPPHLGGKCPRHSLQLLCSFLHELLKFPTSVPLIIPPALSQWLLPPFFLSRNFGISLLFQLMEEKSMRLNIWIKPVIEILGNQKRFRLVSKKRLRDWESCAESESQSVSCELWEK